MRVLHVYSGNLYGGVETFLVTLARQASCCPEMEPHYALCFEGRLSGELTAAGAPVSLLGPARISRPWTVWMSRRRLDHLLARETFDVVICHGCWPHVLFGPVVRARRLPLVFWSHDAPTGRSWLERRARNVPPDLALTSSGWTQAELPKLFPDAPSEMVYYPVVRPELADPAMVRRRVRAVLGTPEGTVVIMQSSRLESWKGHHLLLRALGGLPAEPAWECWIAGGAQRPREVVYLDELQAAAARLGVADRVRFLGQRSDVADLGAAADLHCQPNTGPEPFGIAFVEALYAGLPVVTTAMGGGQEIVTGACGALVAPGDAGELAAVLRRLIQNPALRRRLGAAGPARARELCDPAAQIGRLKELLASVARREVLACH